MNDEGTPFEAGSLAQHFPAPLTHLIGREAELEAVATLLCRSDVRLVTLSGSGGVGKTRLAVEAGKRAAPSFSDGAVFVDLAAVNEPTFVAVAIAQSLGIADTSAPLEEQLETALIHRQQLLVLDNFEHVVDAAPLVVRLIAAAPGLKVLVTSRVRLRLSSEIEYAVPPLALPEGNESGATLGDIASVQLFVERALAVNPTFALSGRNGASVMEICRRLDGLPLAIELAAARIKVVPPTELLSRLEKRLPLLTGGARDLPARQQTMRDTIAWSHHLLTSDEQSSSAGWRCLSVVARWSPLRLSRKLEGTSGWRHSRESPHWWTIACYAR